MNRVSFGEKIMVQKSINSHHDFDLEIGESDVALRDRGSNYTLTSECESTRDPPISPGTAAATAWMRPSSVSRGHGPYETTSELVTAVPGMDGRKVMVVTPTPALTAAGRHERPESPRSLHPLGSLKGDR